MQRQDLTTNDLHALIDSTTLPLDLVASWETLCDTYDTLRFSDDLTDTQRLEEYKWIIHQMNKFLTGIRKKLLTSQSHEAALDLLRNTMIPKGDPNITDRKAFVYQKLRQQWILTESQMIYEMQMTMQNQVKGELDVWDEYGIA